MLTALALVACVEQARPPATAADPTEAALQTIAPDTIRAHIRFLADDLLEGRGTGTRGYDIAAKYVAARFMALGLAPAGEDGTYFQNISFRETRPVADSATLVLKRGHQAVELVESEHFIVAPDPLETRTGISAGVVFAGFGVTAPGLGYDDYAGLDVEGKIVAHLNNAPASFPNDQRAYYSSSVVKRTLAAQRGAIGTIAIFQPEDETRSPWERIIRGKDRPRIRWLEPSGQPHGAIAAIKGAALLSQAGAAVLFDGQAMASEEVFSMASAGDPPRFDLNITAEITGQSRHRALTSANVAALLAGSDPDLADEYVVFSAHLDHLGIGREQDGDVIYNGAYDNAAGIAILLEIARAFLALDPAPRRSILFLAVTGEEVGLRGSDFFANNPTVPEGSIVANINLDMTHMLHPLHDVIAFGASHSSLGSDVEAAAAQLGLDVSPDPFPELVVFIRSDHYSFVRKGIPAISLFPGFATGDAAVDGAKLFGDWMATIYHKPGDDLDQPFDFAAGAKFAQVNLLVGLRVANSDKAPSWNPGDFFGEKFGL